MKSENKPKFNPTPEMITATKAVLAAKALVLTIRPIVEGYEKEILAKHRFTNKAEVAMLTEHGHEAKERVILDPKESYQMGDEDFNAYWNECKAERERNGLKVERDDFCPLLVAENLERQANRVLLEAMQPITGIDPDDLWNMDHRKQLIDLSIKLIAAYCRENNIDLEGGF
ncbi:MAG: hypothetical protein M0P61_00385 [Ignavibacteriaceae bacterium]|jgi:hypothetical protein|nr:hypothetical protein [Ignavibacteriaceae bacterium]